MQGADPRRRDGKYSTETKADEHLRHYLYIWHDPVVRMIVASGLEFKDVIPALQDADGIVLRKGSAGTARKPAACQTVARQQLAALAQEDLYAWAAMPGPITGARRRPTAMRTWPRCSATVAR